MTEIQDLSAIELLQRYRAKTLSPTEVFAAIEKHIAGWEPHIKALYAYAPEVARQQAAEQAKSLDPKKVAEVIKSGKKFKTVIGEMSYDKKGDITRPDYVMYVWKKGQDGKIDYSGNELPRILP